MLEHALGATSTDHTDALVGQHNSALEVHSVDSVLTIRLIETETHLFVVLLVLLLELHLFKVQTRRFYGKLRVDNKCENCLVVPVDRDVGGDVVTERHFGSQHPLLVLAQVDLRVTALLATHHKDGFLVLEFLKNDRSWAHRVWQKVWNWG